MIDDDATGPLSVPGGHPSFAVLPFQAGLGATPGNHLVAVSGAHAGELEAYLSPLGDAKLVAEASTGAHVGSTPRRDRAQAAIDLGSVLLAAALTAFEARLW